MTEALEIRTPHADVSDVVRELAPSVDDLSIRLPCERPIAEGEWVRFMVQLVDGTTVFEGVGRSQGTRPDGPRFRVHLSMLQFDERNEIMYERMLLARDAESERTGQIDLAELGAELIRAGSRSGPAPARSAPPPPPLRAKPPVPRRPSAPPPSQVAPKPSAPPRSRAASNASSPPSRVARKPGAPRPGPAAPPPSATAPAPARPRPSSLPPVKAPLGPKPAAPPPTPPSRAEAAPKAPSSAPPRHVPPEPEALAGAADDLVTRQEQLPEAAHRPRRRRRPQRVPVDDAELATSDTVVSRPAELHRPRPLSLEVPPHLVERARALAPTLPAELTGGRGASPEEAVLRTALRLGLASLAALGDDDEP